MPLPIADVLGILSDNLRIREGALPLSVKKATAWAKGLHIPVGGETVLYTGQMYQLTPSINTMSHQMARLEDSAITKFFKVGRSFNKAINLSRFMGSSDRAEQAMYDNILRKIAHMLKMTGVEFGYLYNQDLYTGALLYDEGVDDSFIQHIHRLYRIFQKNGVKQVITVDPHTTNMLRSVFPSFNNEYCVEVRNYLEILAERDLNSVKELNLNLVIHDSCIYARHEGIIREPRLLLENVGVEVHEPVYSGRLTHCCGGPLESLFPAKCHEIANKRVEQLTSCGYTEITTMCPICMANLKRAGGPNVQVKDIAEYLYMAYYAENKLEFD
jgi:Fe-S oxidoreductase